MSDAMVIDSPSGGPSSPVVLAAVRDAPLSVDEVLDAVRTPAAGGIALFVGVVRARDHGHDVDALDYTAHPSAEQTLHRVAGQVAAGHELTRVAAVHRTGHLVVGDLAVVVGASSPHRDEALTACRELIDTLKTTVPIWKHQLFADGGQEWVGSP
ncbi:MAG TPA: molybdenum cofactor biosynthesis protein MoaE [Dermatophilaceae bacterium]|nr:molybdenum cofactor biosynthesis protein MoaE [Dermatophilaceae bacterium]